MRVVQVLTPEAHGDVGLAAAENLAERSGLAGLEGNGARRKLALDTPDPRNHLFRGRSVLDPDLDCRGVKSGRLSLVALRLDVPADVAEYGSHRGIVHQSGLQNLDGLGGSPQLRTFGKFDAHFEGALVDVGQKVPIEVCGQDQASGERTSGDGQDGAAAVEGAGEDAVIPNGEDVEQAVEHAEERRENGRQDAPREFEPEADQLPGERQRAPDDPERQGQCPCGYPGHLARERGGGRFCRGWGCGCVRGLRLVPPEVRGHGGEEGERNRQAREQGERHREREGGEEFPGHPLDVDDRSEDGDRREGGRGDRSLHLFRAPGRGLQGAHPGLAVSEDVLQDDDRVVDQHAHPERESPQAHDVQGHAESIHEREGADHGNRNRQGNRHRVARVAQEEEEDYESEQATQDQCLDHVADRLVDECGLVGRDLGNEVGILLPEEVEGLLHILRNRHRVGAGLLEDEESNRLGGVVPRNFLPLGKAVHHRRDIPQPHQPERGILITRLAGLSLAPAELLLADDDVADFLDGLELAQRT